MGFEPTYRHPIALTRPLRLGSAIITKAGNHSPSGCVTFFHARHACRRALFRSLPGPAQSICKWYEDWQNGQSVAEALDDLARFVDKVEPLVSSE